MGYLFVENLEIGQVFGLVGYFIIVKADFAQAFGAALIKQKIVIFETLNGF
jgi:hypothetical protein